MTRGHTTILQLSDLHLFAEPEGLFHDVPTRPCFERVLGHVLQHYGSPDLAVITGDLAHDGATATYRYLADTLQVLQAPVYYVLGNHDHPINAQSVYPCGTMRGDPHCLLGPWQIILLDSNHLALPGSEMGEISDAELQRLARLSAQHADRWTVIAMHHNLPAHEDRGVCLEIRNHQRVMRYFEGLSNIKLVLSGHIHQEFVIVQQGICYLSAPATGYQSPSRSGRITGKAPGYRWLRLYDDGRFETDVRRINYWVS